MGDFLNSIIFLGLVPYALVIFLITIFLNVLLAWAVLRLNQRSKEHQMVVEHLASMNIDTSDRMLILEDDLRKTNTTVADLVKSIPGRTTQ